MKKIILVVAILGLVTQINAQTDIDALRFSRTQVIGSARTMGMGGSFSALGGDFSAIGVNPAGIATYRGSQFVITPSFQLNKTTSDYDNAEIDRDATKFNLSNIGAVFAQQDNPNSKWKTKNLAIGTNRIGNYYQSFNYNGITTGSILERWVESAQTFRPDQLGNFEDGLAYDAGLIFHPGVDTTQYASDLLPDDLIGKEEDFESSGYMNEIIFAFGGNYNHKLYVGGSIGIPLIQYEQNRTYEEWDAEGAIPFFDGLVFEERLLTNGGGINAKFGLIYRLNQAYRVSVAVHSPTVLALTDDYSTSVSSNIDFGNGPESYTADSPNGTFDYGISSPWRLIVGGARFMEGLGVLTAEVEYVDYTKMAFDFNVGDNPDEADYEFFVNNNIATKYRKTVNIRLGAEIARGIFRLRGGYALNGAPIQSNLTTEPGVLQHLTLGAGVQQQGFFLDVGFVQRLMKQEYVPYQTENSPNTLSVTNSLRNQQVVATIGFKF